MRRKVKKYLNKNTIVNGVNKMREKGFLSVFLGSLLVKCISFCSVLFLPRIIADTSQYGVLSIVDNFNSYLLIVSGLGLSNSILRFCVLQETYAGKRAIFEFCLKWGMVINGCILVLVILGLSNIDLSIEGLEIYLFIGLALPMFSYVFDCISLFLRADMKNKEYARISVIYTVLYGGFQILLALGYKVMGAIVGRYMAYIIIIVVAIIIIKKKSELFSTKPLKLSRDEKKQLIYFAIGGLFANAFSIIMPMNEQMVVTAIIADETQTAFYRAASIGPTNLQFIANAVVICIYPYFTRHSDDFDWIKKKTFVTIGLLGAIILPMAIILFCFSPFLIKFIFGADYMPALGLMRIMWFTFSINSILRMPLGSILGAIGKVKFNAINSGITAICHIILDCIFITIYGINGAVIALTIAYTVSGLVNLLYIFYLYKKKRKESL